MVVDIVEVLPVVVVVDTVEVEPVVVIDIVEVGVNTVVDTD